ncbi:DUF1510 family protein [Bacillus timonensis]|nr:DUF1510 family protein [Bacillus timonensis]
MGYDFNKLYEGPRYERRSKRRRINTILNLLIGIVFVLIIIFASKLLFGKEENVTPVSSTQEQSNNQSDKQSENGQSNNAENKQNNEKSGSTTDNEDRNVNSSETEETDSRNLVVTEGDPESNIIRSIKNEDWKPIKTSQEEPHVVNYEDGSVDRLEMEQAISYATGLDISNMTVWWLQNNGHNKVAATVSTRDNGQIYRVYINWESNLGWKPVLIEELRENDSPYYKNNQNNESESESDND